MASDAQTMAGALLSWARCRTDRGGLVQACAGCFVARANPPAGLFQLRRSCGGGDALRRGACTRSGLKSQIFLMGGLLLL